MNNSEPYSETNSGLHYDLALNVDPQTHFLAVSGSVAYHAPENGLERARFYLHSQFTIQRLEGRKVLGYHFQQAGQPDTPGLPVIPEASVLDVYFDPPLAKNETVLIRFEYQGVISNWAAGSMNVVNPEWAELGMYLPWFPLQYNGAPSNLTFTLKVTAPSEYQVSSYGPHAMEEGAWYFTWIHPTTDIVVAIGRQLNLHVFESDTNRVFLASSTFSEAAAARLGEDLLWILERLSGWFGPTRPASLTLIESPRPMGGGYARRGLVVLAGLNEHDYLEQREAYMRYLAHEAAHAWWWEAPSDTWEDWLNESFAEYSALMAIRERFGQETFERFMAHKRERAPETLPMWEFPRADGSVVEKQAILDRMLYDKGPLLLDNLARRIGYQRFLDLCRAMLWSGVTDTGHLLELLEELEDADTRTWMEKQLK